MASCKHFRIVHSGDALHVLKNRTKEEGIVRAVRPAALVRGIVAVAERFARFVALPAGPRHVLWLADWAVGAAGLNTCGTTAIKRLPLVARVWTAIGRVRIAFRMHDNRGSAETMTEAVH